VQVPESERQLWMVDVIAPFGGAEEMVKELKVRVHPQTPLRYVSLGADGKNVVSLLT
jgi:hemolysin-activating ACP:hemolysin acyltransferase